MSRMTPDAAVIRISDLLGIRPITKHLETIAKILFFFLSNILTA